MKDETRTEAEAGRVLRLFGASAPAVQQVVGAFPSAWGLTAHCRSRGGETLVALRAKRPDAIEKGEHSLRSCFPADLYGAGEQGLAAATIQALEQHKRLLVCASATAGALIESRLEAVEGAEQVFDFGALSYAHEKTGPRIEAQAARRAGQGRTAQQELARVHAALRLVGAELSAGCVERKDSVLLLLGTKKGCWLRTVRPEDNPALWLLDMVRRAACGCRQAEGTHWQRYRTPVEEESLAPLPAPPAEQETAAAAPAQGQAVAAATVQRPRRHGVRRVLALLLVLVLVVLAGAWYYTGGDLAALPEALGWQSEPHSGALLL